MSHKTTHIQFAALCRSFAHPTRVAILEKLAGKEHCVENEIVTIDEIAETTVIEHLRSMKNEGIIRGRLNRSQMSYCINWDKLEEFKFLFDRLYDRVKQHQENILCNNGTCD
jgi:ArsR family transcriptional regulator